MKRFSTSIKSLGITGYLYSYACFCFSLLANCTCIELARTYYTSICTIFLSPVVSKSVIEAKTIIETAVIERPEDIKQLNNILEHEKLQVQTLNIDFSPEELMKDPMESKADLESNSTSDSDSDSDSTKEYNEPFEDILQDTLKKETISKFKDGSIKNNSKFSKFFRDIRDEVDNNLDTLGSNASITNIFQNVDLLNHFENKYMPYYFIWGSLVLKGTKWTRMSNGVLEKHQGFMKNNVDKDVLPHKHLIPNYTTVNGLCNEYLSSLEGNNQYQISETKSSKRTYNKITKDESLEEDSGLKATES